VLWCSISFESDPCCKEDAMAEWAEWFVWISNIWKEYALADWFGWIFRVWVVIGILVVAANLKHILACVRDINNKMDKLDDKRDALPSIDSFLSGIRSAGKRKIPDDSNEGL
jgi:hypothetical protein